MTKPIQQIDPPTPEVATKVITVLQISRIGDLIQTVTACMTLKKDHPDIKLKLIARSQFAQPIKDLLESVFDEIHLFRLRDFFSGEDKSLDATLKKIRAFLDQVEETPNNVLINLTFSKSSSYLSSLIKAQHKLGLTRTATGELSIPDRWSRYVYSTVMNGPLNPLSIVDIFNQIVGKQNSLNFRSERRNSNIIAIHPFASSEKKFWRPQKWSEVFYKILKEMPETKILLLGGPSEKSLAQELLAPAILSKFTDRIENHVGKTNVNDLMTLLSSAQLFMGHDSMISHLAALTHTQSLIISLGTVRTDETSPYLENCYVLSPKASCFPCFPTDKCDNHLCHSEIPFQLVTSTVSLLMSNQGKLSKEEIIQRCSVFHLSSVNIHRTTFTEHGLQILEDILEETPSSMTIMKSLYRIAWLYFLGNIEEKSRFPILNRATHAELLKALQSLKYIYELSEFGKKYSAYILQEIAANTPDIAKIKGHSTKIDEIDQLQGLVKKTNPLMSPLIDYFIVSKANLEGDNIVKLSESSYRAFQDASLLTSILYELVEKTVTEYKLKHPHQGATQEA